MELSRVGPLSRLGEREMDEVRERSRDVYRKMILPHSEVDLSFFFFPLTFDLLRSWWTRAGCSVIGWRC